MPSKITMSDVPEDETVILLWQQRWTGRVSSIVKHPFATLISLERVPWYNGIPAILKYLTVQSGFHMGFYLGGMVAEATWPTVEIHDQDVDQLTHFGDYRLHVFLPNLSNEQEKILWYFLKCIEGRPYDVCLISNRAVQAAKRLWEALNNEAFTQKDIKRGDSFKELAFICYEVVARGMNKVKNLDLDPALFGPTDLWDLAKSGDVTYLGAID